MRTQHGLHRSLVRRITSLVILVLTLIVVTPVLAAYIGPKRTVTETQKSCKVVLYACQYVASKGEYRFHQINNWNCANEGKPWLAYPSQPPSQGCTSSNKGDKYWEKEESEEQVTTTYPAATINGVLQNCTLNNGWCITSPQLSLSGIEPVTGYTILGIEGTWNGQAFACTGSSCSLSLPEGNSNFTYWALSSFGDTSTMGALNARVDSQQPTISGTLTGTSGSNGWYTSPVVFNGLASDATSGLAGISCTLDGVALGSCSSITVSSEGPHTLVLTAWDNAGQARSLTQSVSVDTQNPLLDVSLVGTHGSNPDWYTSAVLNGSASDASPGSGLAAFEYQLDQDSWKPFPASGELALPAGKHTVEVRAIDNAGLLTTSPLKSFWLDRLSPAIAIDASGTLGENNWYTTDVDISASASDETSGLKSFEYSLDNDPWTSYTAPLLLTDGIHDVLFWASDEAGQETQTSKAYKIDTRNPVIGGSLSGVPGEADWFTSDVTFSASASDPQPGSGISAFTYSLDGSPQDPYINPLILSDGRHTIQLSAQDHAGLPSTAEQIVNVDTIPPALDIQTTLPGWVRETVTLDGTAKDDGSGLSRLEISTNGGQTWQPVPAGTTWSYRWDTSSDSNGPDEVLVRAVDKAGLVTQKTLKAGVDNSAPGITLPDSWLQWDTVALDIWDDHSGLSEARLEISDPQGRWPARIIPLDSAQFPMQLKWDRRFGDGTEAPAGNYDVKVSAQDKLGNSATKTASIKVLLDLLPPGPTATPIPPVRPSATPTISHPFTATPANTATPSVVVKGFGSTLEPAGTATQKPYSTPFPRSTPTQSSAIDRLGSIFKNNSETTENSTQIGALEESGLPIQATPFGSNVLWGATAAAVIGSMTAYALEEKRRQQEEKAQQEALAAQKKQRQRKIKAQKTAKLEAQWAQERAWEAARAKEEQQEALYQNHMEARVLGREIAEEEKRVAEEKAVRERIEEQKREKERQEAAQWNAAMAAYSAARRKADEPVATPAKKPSIWEKALGWVDEHQTEIALGLGVAVGVAAIVLSGGVATPLVAAAWVGGAAAVAAGTVAAGTVALNRHFGREWNTNLLKNVALAGTAAAVVAGGWFLFHAASSGIGAYCYQHQSTCAHVEPVLNTIDTVEELSLNAKLGYQTWRGDLDGASQTALDLQMEHMDGGMPGNAVAKQLGAEAIEAAAKYGDDALELVMRYGDDATKIILKYKEEGVSVLQKHGREGIQLIQSYGDNAVHVLKAVELDNAKTLLQTLDDDVLKYAVGQGPDALEALAGWSSKDLSLDGLEIALRSKKDAKALADVNKLVSLGPIDPRHLTDEQQALIDSIAESSTQYAGNGQIVLGKWVDYDSGFIETARDTGSMHYGPHPDIWNKLSGLGKENQDQVAWLVNQQVIQTGIGQGLPFEYTLNGIPVDKINNEMDAVEAIFSGATDQEIMKFLKTDYLPVRMKEIQTLQKAGYEISFDDITNSYILIRP